METNNTIFSEINAMHALFEKCLDDVRVAKIRAEVAKKVYEKEDKKNAGSEKAHEALNAYVAIVKEISNLWREYDKKMIALDPDWGK